MTTVLSVVHQKIWQRIADRTTPFRRQTRAPKADPRSTLGSPSALCRSLCAFAATAGQLCSNCFLFHYITSRQGPPEPPVSIVEPFVFPVADGAPTVARKLALQPPVLAQPETKVDLGILRSASEGPRHEGQIYDPATGCGGSWTGPAGLVLLGRSVTGSDPVSVRRLRL